MKIKAVRIEPVRSTGSDETARSPFSSIGAKGKLNERRKEALYAELCSLLTSGLDFNSSFTLLIESEKNKKNRSVLQQVYEHVVKGDSLWHAFETIGYFSPLDYGVVKIGEETGKMDQSFLFLSDYYKKRMEQRRMITGAVSYPLVILTTAVIVLLFMVGFIVPMFEQVYARMGSELPSVTKAVIALARDLPFYLFTGIFLLVGLVLLIIFSRDSELNQKVTSAVLLKIPFMGTMIRKHHQANFCKLLALLISCGVPLLYSIELIKGIIRFYPYRKSFESVSRGLEQGKRFAECVAAFPELYNPRLIVMLKVGEETNKLEEMLEKQGRDLTADMEHALKQVGTMLEPLLIVLVGSLVAVILIAMYMPMFKLGSAVY